MSALFLPALNGKGHRASDQHFGQKTPRLLLSESAECLQYCPFLSIRHSMSRTSGGLLCLTHKQEALPHQLFEKGRWTTNHF